MDELTLHRAKRILPPELLRYYQYDPQSGHIIYCVLEQDLEDILVMDEDGWQDYLLPIPLPYVIQHGYKVVDGLVVVEADYHEENGLLMDMRYVLHGPLTEESLMEKRQNRHQIGDRIEVFAGLAEGSRLTINENGLLLLLLLSSPDEEVLEQVAPGGHVQLFLVKQDGVMFLISRFGSLPRMDAPYYPGLNPRPVHLEAVMDGQGYRLTIMVVDNTDGTIKSLRLIPLTTQFSRDIKRVHDDISTFSITHHQFGQAMEKVGNMVGTEWLHKASISPFETGKKLDRRQG